VSDERCAEFKEDMENLVQKVEFVFDIPCHLSDEHYMMLRKVMNAIVDAPYNQLKEGVHWASTEGSKPTFSKNDSRILGMPRDPDAPLFGEPTFDDTILQFASTSREFVNEPERNRVLLDRQKQRLRGTGDI